MKSILNLLQKMDESNLFDDSKHYIEIYSDKSGFIRNEFDDDIKCFGTWQKLEDVLDEIDFKLKGETKNEWTL